MKVPIELIGCEVGRTAFDYQVRLTLFALDPDEGYRVDAELVIETPFLLRDDSGEWHEVEPGSVDTLEPTLHLFGQTVAAVEVSDGGTLSVDFRNGAGFFVGVDQTYTSWELTGHGVAPVTVGPGGEGDWQR